MNFKAEMNAVLGKAKDFADTTAKKTDEVIKVSGLKLNCIQVDNEIKNKYIALGKMVYGMVKHDTADSAAISDAVTDIDLLYAKLETLQSKIEEVRKIVTCPVCEAKNKFGTIHCTNCGHRLVLTDEDVDEYDYISQFDE